MKGARPDGINFRAVSQVSPEAENVIGEECFTMVVFVRGSTGTRPEGILTSLSRASSSNRRGNGKD